MKEGADLPDKKTNIELDKAFWESKPVSATDCTGLVQGLPLGNESVDIYAKMYNISPQDGAGPVKGPDNSVGASKKQMDKENVEP